MSPAAVCGWQLDSNAQPCSEVPGTRVGGGPVSDGRCAYHSADPAKDPAQILKVFANNGVANAFPCQGWVFNVNVDLAGPWVEADFRGASFLVGARFKGAFGRLARFDGAIFEGPVSFVGSRFEGGASFAETRFKREADFTGATSIEAQFPDSAFDESAHFSSTLFESARFDRARFSGLADFQGGHVGRFCSFEFARFAESVSFAGRRFGGAASFFSAHFEGAAIFTNCVFDVAPHFTHTTFKGAQFRGVDFRAPTTFDGTSFGRNPDAASDFGETDLRQVTFRRCELARAKFAEARSTAEAEYDAVNWGTIHGFPRRISYVVCEEADARTVNSQAGYAVARRVYALVRSSYEDHKDLVMADRFLFRELEMRRLAEGLSPIGRRTPGWRWLRQHVISLRAAYWCLSDYGQSLLKPPLFLALGVACFFPLAYALAGVGQLTTTWWWQGNGSWEAYGEALAFSARAAALVPDQTVNNQPVPAQLLLVCERLLSPFLGLLFALAVRRHFRR